MLTDAHCRAAKPKEQLYRLNDLRGLYLEVKPNGVKAWRYRFKAGRQGVVVRAGRLPCRQPCRSAGQVRGSAGWSSRASTPSSTGSRRLKREEDSIPSRPSPKSGWLCGTGRTSPRNAAWTCWSGWSSQHRQAPGARHHPAHVLDILTKTVKRGLRRLSLRKPSAPCPVSSSWQLPPCGRTTIPYGPSAGCPPTRRNTRRH